MKRIVLVGAGHAHLEVLKALRKEEVAGKEFVLISPERHTFYSGLIPQLISGSIEAKDLRINSAEFAEEKGFKFIQDQFLSYNQMESSVTLASGRTESFDLLSLNIGGAVRRLPTLASQDTIYLKPFSAFVEQWQEVQRSFLSSTNLRFVVVGGGAAAVEVATALKTRLNRSQLPRGEVHLVTQGSRLCKGYDAKVSESIRETAEKFGIQLHFNEGISQILDKYIVLRNGTKLNFDSIFLALPADASPLILGRSNDFLELDENVFATGDCVSMENHLTLPRSGVLAVHQGRHLLQSIRRKMGGEAIEKFIPKEKLLNILITGDHSARIVWGSRTFEGKVAFTLKNWIDQRYMKSFV